MRRLTLCVCVCVGVRDGEKGLESEREIIREIGRVVCFATRN